MSAARGGFGRGDRGQGDRGRGGRGRGDRGRGDRGRGNQGRDTRDADTKSGDASIRGKTNGSTNETAKEPTQKRGQQGEINTRGKIQQSEKKTNVFTAPAPVSSNSTPIAENDFKKRLEYMRDDRPRQRDRFIQEGLMNPEGQMRLSDAVKLVGICTDMCPEFERVRRIAEEDVKAPECTPETEHLPRKQRVPDQKRMVKAYARSAAGMDVELVSDLRSPATLQKTMDYLFKRLDNDEFGFLYGWIWDRTRAVRKDFRTQGVDKPRDIATYLNCFEQCARFLLLSLHCMAKSGKADYDHQQDLEQFNQTWMSLRERYKDNQRAGIPSANEAEFWAYRIILASHYNSTQLEHEMHGLPNHLRLNGRVQTAVHLFHAIQSVLFNKPKVFVQTQANWKKLWDLVKSSKVSYLMACAAEVSFNRVRHVVIDTIWQVYRRGTTNKPVVIEDWTVPKLREVLGLDTDHEIITFCQAFGFSFGETPDGQSFLDITSISSSDRHLRFPSGLKAQAHSERIVESKRHNRALSAVIQGMSVRTAKHSGLMMDVQIVTEKEMEEVEAQEEDESSLFVPDRRVHTTNQTTASPFNQTPKTVGSASGATPQLNPFAPSFQPGGTPGSSSASMNPFGPSLLGHKATPEAPKSAFTSDNPFQTAAAKASPGLPGPSPANVQPGLFDPSKNPIQFATPSSATDSPFSSIKTGNPFAPAGPSNATSNPFSDVSKTNAMAKTPEQTTGPSTSQSAPPFSFANFTASESKPKGTPTFKVSPPVDPTLQEEERRKKAEEDQRKALEEQKRAAEEQQRAAREQQQRAQEEQERLARELEQRRLQQEQLKRRAQEQARKAKEEQERRAQEAEQRRLAQIEEARKAREQEMEAAMDSLVEEILQNAEDCLLTQFIENTVMNLTREAAVELQEARANQKAEEMYQQKRLSFVRAVCARWVSQVEKKKRARKVRNRRKWLRENAEKLANLETEVVGDVPSPSAPLTTEQPNSTSAFKKPAVPTGSSRGETQLTMQPKSDTANKAPQKAKLKHKTPSAKALRVSRSTASVSSDITSHTDYLMTHRKSTAPIDRTETDWFELRAMGIDPSKHRKRSFNSDSDDEEKREMEPKRARTSPSPSSRRSLPPPTTDEERLARFQAVRDALNSSSSTPVPINGARSVNGKSSLLIAQARELIANASKHSPPNVQHGYSRSVPDFGMSTSSGRQSAFGQSIGAPQSNARPAYWGRTSRFVPSHLYGKGAEAILAYRNQFIKKSPPNTEPLQLSSPVPTQHAFVPQDDAQSCSEEEASEDEGSHAAGGAHGYVHEDAIMTDEEEEYEEDEEDMEEQAHDQQHGQVYYEEDDSNLEEGEEEDYSDEDEEMEETEEETEQEFSQSRQQLNQAGFTQDDAIELSD